MFEGLSGKRTRIASTLFTSDIHGTNRKRPETPIKGGWSSSEEEEIGSEMSINFSQVKLHQLYLFFSKQKK